MLSSLCSNSCGGHQLCHLSTPHFLILSNVGLRCFGLAATHLLSLHRYIHSFAPAFSILQYGQDDSMLLQKLPGPVPFVKTLLFYESPFCLIVFIRWIFLNKKTEAPS